MAIILEAITHVWNAGRLIPPGEVFSADNKFGEMLVKGGSAKVKDSVKQEKTPDLNDLKVSQLQALAEKLGVEIPDKTKKDGIIAILEKVDGVYENI